MMATSVEVSYELSTRSALMSLTLAAVLMATFWMGNPVLGHPAIACRPVALQVGALSGRSEQHNNPARADIANGPRAAGAIDPIRTRTQRRPGTARQWFPGAKQSRLIVSATSMRSAAAILQLRI